MQTNADNKKVYFCWSEISLEFEKTSTFQDYWSNLLLAGTGEPWARVKLYHLECLVSGPIRDTQADWVVCVCPGQFASAGHRHHHVRANWHFSKKINLLQSNRLRPAVITGVFAAVLSHSPTRVRIDLIQADIYSTPLAIAWFTTSSLTRSTFGLGIFLEYSKYLPIRWSAIQCNQTLEQTHWDFGNNLSNLLRAVVWQAFPILCCAIISHTIVNTNLDSRQANMATIFKVCSCVTLGSSAWCCLLFAPDNLSTSANTCLCVCE